MPIADTLVRDNLGRRLEEHAFAAPAMDFVVYDAKGRLVQSYYSQRRLAEALTGRALTLKPGDLVAVVPRGARR